MLHDTNALFCMSLIALLISKRNDRSCKEAKKMTSNQKLKIPVHPVLISLSSLKIDYRQPLNKDKKGVNLSKVIGWAVFSLRQSAPP